MASRLSRPVPSPSKPQATSSTSQSCLWLVVSRLCSPWSSPSHPQAISTILQSCLWLMASRLCGLTGPVQLTHDFHNSTVSAWLMASWLCGPWPSPFVLQAISHIPVCGSMASQLSRQSIAHPVEPLPTSQFISPYQAHC